MDLHLIVACDLEWNIGRGSQLLFRISEDLRRFKALTVGHPIVYGRKTLSSFPKGNPLPERPNIILSRNPGYHREHATVVHDLGDLFATLRRIGDPEVFVIGGGDVFKQLIPYCRTAYVTRVLSVFLADVHIPNLDRCPGWTLAEQGTLRHDNGLPYRYDRYENRSPWPMPEPGTNAESQPGTNAEGQSETYAVSQPESQTMS